MKSSRKKIYFIISLSIPILFWIFYSQSADKKAVDFSQENKIIYFNDNGFVYKTSTRANSVEEFFKEKQIGCKNEDLIIPAPEKIIYSGAHIEIQRAVKIKIEADGKTIENYTLAKSVRHAILENNLSIGRLDLISPAEDSQPSEDMVIKITRINVEEKIITEDIDYKTTVKLDGKLSWREKKIEQPGEKGERAVKYKITYKNNKEISRVILEKTIIREPASEIVVQGTYVKTGTVHTGLGTWYKQPAHLFIGSDSGEGLYAANPWLPKGSYVKVTNKANGKSVIVRINDRGPFGPNRIIDLHTVAFAKIASLGTGVINVKVEEVLN